MRCANCGADVANGTIFCPHCGHRLIKRASVPPATFVPTRSPVAYEIGGQEEEAVSRPSGCRWVLLTGLFTLLFLVVIVGVGALAVYHGLQDQSRERRQVAQTHYEKGLAQLSQGNYDLAAAEFEEAVRLYPEFIEARNKLNEARSLAARKPSPTADPRREVADRLYREARAFYDQREWEKAIAKLDELRAFDATYQTQNVQTLLFWAYYYDGLALVEQGRLEEAIHRFDQALALQPAHPDAARQRQLASLYVAGLRYWRADWAKTIEQFAQLYTLDPGYRDVRQRLHDAHVYYGDLLAEREKWCEAKKQYDAALKIIPTQEVAQRRDKVAQQCPDSG